MDSDQRRIENQFYMWGERGLVATFLLDLCLQSSPIAMLRFVEEIELADGEPIEFCPRQMWCMVEPDFGNRGFGHPDAVIVLENAPQDKIVVLFEAKRGTYYAAMKSRGEEGFNSSINGQLELNYRLTLALSVFSPKDKVLEETSWISDTRYETLRKLKNPNVIEKVVKPISGLGLSSYYHVILTNDRTNPLMSGSSILPELYDEYNNNRWDDLKSRFGWINYESLRNIAENSVEDGQFLATWDINSTNIETIRNLSNDMKSRGVSVIYAPEICSDDLLHFSWREESTALRRYENEFSKPIPIRKYSTSEVRDKIEKEKIPTGRGMEWKSIDNIKHWYNYIQEVKKEWNIT